MHVRPGSSRRRTLTRLLTVVALLAVLGAQSADRVPDEARRRNNLGVALMDAGLKDPKYFVEAVREFDAAARLASGYMTARLNLGLALYFAGQTARADATLRRVIHDRPGEPHAEYVLGLLREYEAQFDAAAEHFRRVAERDPLDPDAWYHLGFCLGKAGRPKDAVEPLGRAAALAPYQRRIRYALYMALTRAGRSEDAQRELERFRALDASQIRVVEGPKNALEYLKQGHYAEAVADSRQQAPPPAPPRYADATRAAGLVTAAPPRDRVIADLFAGAPVPAASFATAARRRSIQAAVGAAAAFCDLDRDGRLDIAWVRNGALTVMMQRGPGRFVRAPVAGAAALVPTATAVASGDMDNDGWPDLVVAGPGRVAVLRNEAGRPRAAAGALVRVAPRDLQASALALADMDHDGDLDVVVAGGVRLDRAGAGSSRYPDDFAAASNVVLRNNGDGSFADISRESGLADVGTPVRGFWFGDVDDDHAIDAVAVDIRAAGHVFLNHKDGSFVRAAASVSSPRFSRLPPGEARAYGDFDADGGVDEIVVSRDGVMLHRNVTAPPHWLTVRVAGYAVPGKVKSNTLGIGTRVEVRSAGRWERREIRAGNGLGGSDAPEATFDLGADTRMDFVRAVFPSGVRRTLRDVAANQAIRIEEPLLDVNSCPTLFTWDGHRFAFITDTLSAGILGELVAPGEYWAPDSDEWVRIRGDQLVPRDGALDVRFTNPLEETTYLDNVRLIAVDHPGDLDVYSDDRMLGSEQKLHPRLYLVGRRRPVARALDQHGHDVSAALRAIDRRYFDHFALGRFKGFAGAWSLTLDLGPLPAARRPLLGLYGWSYWNSSASIVAATQAGQTLWGPALDVLDRSGRWRRATDDLGLPAGLPRDVVVDLSPLLRPGEHVVRIRANRTLYFDQAWVGEGTAGPLLDRVAQQAGDRLPRKVRITEAALADANLRWLGYPRRTLPDGRLPEVFDYADVDQDADWKTPTGLLTRFGDVGALLASVDDRFVVMGHGEEIALRFDARRLPPVPPGWRRTWFFFGDGFEKGNELYSADGETVGPLPYHAMRGYPNDGSGAPHDASYLRYVLDWNTRPWFMRTPPLPTRGSSRDTGD